MKDSILLPVVVVGLSAWVALIVIEIGFKVWKKFYYRRPRYDHAWVEKCDFCDVEVTHLPPDGLSYCPQCEMIVESNTHLGEQE